ncbi:MAG: hypothetical protein QM504_08720 [Pseudomonadota bacterium]
MSNDKIYNNSYQKGYNLELTSETRNGFRSLIDKHNLTIKKTSELLGVHGFEISSQFLGNIIRQKDAVNIRTKHIDQLMEAFRQLQKNLNPSSNQDNTNTDNYKKNSILQNQESFVFEECRIAEYLRAAEKANYKMTISR